MMSVKKATLLTLVFTLILFFICPLTLSQKLGANYAHQEKQEIPKPTYAVEVIVTNADVFVTDKTGRRVTGLRPENFQIYEDGLRQTLTNFYEVKGREVYSSSLDKEKEQHLQRPELRRAE